MFKKFLILLVSVTAILLMKVPQAFAGEGLPSYTYTIIDNKAVITGFSGEPTFLEIPDFLEYCPVTEIRDNAFCECKSLRQIVLPETLEKMGHHCFYACVSLESMILPDSLKEVGMGCFCGCTSLSVVSISQSMNELPESCFRACTKLADISLPKNITSVGDFCFSGDVSLRNVSMNNSMKKIGDCAFYMCNELKTLYIPSETESIGSFSIGYIPTENGSAVMEDFSISGSKNSAAEKYAKDNKIIFTEVSDSIRAVTLRRKGRNFSLVYGRFIFASFGIMFMIISIICKKRKLKRRIIIKKSEI